MGIRIASFNMHNFNLEKKDLDRIAKIILDNRIDIVAMQEVLAEGRAISGIMLDLDKDEYARKSAFEKSLLSRLGSHWDTYWADPQTKSKFYPYLGNDKRGEGYASNEHLLNIYDKLLSGKVEPEEKSPHNDRVCEIKIYDVSSLEDAGKYRVTAKIDYAPIHIGETFALLVDDKPTDEKINVLQIGVGDRQWSEKEPDMITTLIVDSDFEHESALTNQRFICVRR